MIDIPVEDFDIGGISLMPLLLSFISMLGVGGLFATQVLDVHGGQAAIVGVAFGLVGMGIAYSLRLWWQVSRDPLDKRYGELTIGELIDRYGGGTQPPA